MKKTVLFALENFAPLLAFYATNHFLGIKLAIVVSIVFTLGDMARRKCKAQPFPPLLIFSLLLTLGFGAIDLYSSSAYFYRYESVATNLLTAAFFAASLFGEKSLLQQFQEQQRGAKPASPAVVAYLRLLTGVWVIYYVAKAVFYFWAAEHMSFERAAALRFVVGTASFYALLGASIFGSTYLFRALVWARVLKLSPDEKAEIEARRAARGQLPEEANP